MIGGRGSHPTCPPLEELAIPGELPVRIREDTELHVAQRVVKRPRVQLACHSQRALHGPLRGVVHPHVGLLKPKVPIHGDDGPENHRQQGC